jgi:acetyl-CoA C-acetyltransferase
MSDREKTPVLVGGGQFTEKGVAPEQAHSIIDLMENAVARSLDSAGISKLPDDLSDLIVVNSVGYTVDNPPAELAARLGVSEARLQMTVTGGNTPQMLVNHACAEIQAGRSSSFLLVGAEALDTVQKAKNQSVDLDWKSQAPGEPTLFSVDRAPVSEHESQYGLYLPSTTYPLIENALRHHYGRSVGEHQTKLGELFSRFSKVAANNPYAWFPTERSPSEIATASDENRYIGSPYTKYMNAVLRVNQSAAILVMSESKAREMGVESDRFVYLHGGAGVNDVWNVTERPELHKSPAIELAIKDSFTHAQIDTDDIKYFDLYSCFPSVVQITRDALGLSESDPRSLTVTGGLPYFGGPGNNYVMHSIATMLDRLRQDRGAFGLVTGNGWYVTKHSLGIYSTKPTDSAVTLTPSKALQAEIDAIPKVQVETTPAGPATVETYTVLFDRENQPESAIIMGRLPDQKRFLANAPTDKGLLEGLVARDPIGETGVVIQVDDRNIFHFD